MRFEGLISRQNQYEMNTKQIMCLFNHSTDKNNFNERNNKLDLAIPSYICTFSATFAIRYAFYFSLSTFALFAFLCATKACAGE